MFKLRVCNVHACFQVYGEIISCTLTVKCEDLTHATCLFMSYSLLTKAIPTTECGHEH